MASTSATERQPLLAIIWRVTTITFPAALARDSALPLTVTVEIESRFSSESWESSSLDGAGGAAIATGAGGAAIAAGAGGATIATGADAAAGGVAAAVGSPANSSARSI